MKINQTTKKADGTSFNHVTIRVIPNRLIEKYGLGDTDNYKVAWEWKFEDRKGNIFTLYDYKATSMYSPEFPAPEELMDKLVVFHIGSKTPGLDMKFACAIIKENPGCKAYSSVPIRWS